jgi:hypothetical protein
VAASDAIPGFPSLSIPAITMPRFSMDCKFKKTGGHAFPEHGFIAPFSDWTVSCYPPLSLWTAFRKAA